MYSLDLEKKLFTISFTAKICGEDGQVDPNCFVSAQSIVFSAMEHEYVGFTLPHSVFLGISVSGKNQVMFEGLNTLNVYRIL